jgi:prepilin-type N-terminal cleavage/methylation domain-containing protein
MKNRAFTLIELMIVVSIIAFLAVLAVPQLMRYKAKAYQAEVAMNLASLHTAEQAFFAQHGFYTAELTGPNGLGWKPAGAGNGQEAGFYYTYGFNVPGAQEGVHYFTGKLGAPQDALGSTSAAKEGFTAGAAADVTGKGRVDVWQIDDNRRLTNTINGID